MRYFVGQRVSIYLADPVVGTWLGQRERATIKSIASDAPTLTARRWPIVVHINGRAHYAVSEEEIRDLEWAHHTGEEVRCLGH